MSIKEQVHRLSHRNRPPKQRPAVAPTFGWLRHSIHRLFSFGFGIGLIKVAPGTFGTLLALLLWIPISMIENAYITGLIILVAFVYGVYCSRKTSNDLGVKDYSGIVWDEIVAFWLVLFVIGDDYNTPVWMLLAFVLFRLFDILKPWPISQVDRKLAGGLGIMLDDIIAALYSLFVFALVVRIAAMI